MNFTGTLGIVSGVDDEEVLQRLVSIVTCRKVSQVVTKLHGLFVQFAVGPASEHRHFGSRFAPSAVTVAGILKVFEGHSRFGFRCVQVGRHACAQVEFRAARVVHFEFDGTLRFIVFAHAVNFGHPVIVGMRAVGIESRHSVSVGAVNEAIVAPAVAPRVHDNPGTHLVGRFFAKLAVAVQVELNAVVVAHDGQGVVNLRTPFFNVVFTRHPDFVVRRS